MPGKIQAAFLKTFWSDLREHLADVVKEEVADWSVRPNMVIAAALENSPLSPQQKMHILARAEQKLVTKRGLRTLSPNHLRYEGVVAGSQDQREAAIHMGAVFPWLLQFFAEAYLDIHGRSGLPYIKQLIEGFEETITEHRCV